jgi:hypothetical protein
MRIMFVLAMWVVGLCAAASGQELPPKAPVPTTAVQWVAELTVKGIFADARSKAVMPAEKSALAGKMLQTGTETNDDLGQKYVLLKDAMDLAVAAGDGGTAAAAADALSRSFAVDALQLRIGIYEALGRANRTPYESSGDAQDFGDWLDAQDSTVHPDHFGRGAELALSAARKSGDAKLVAACTARLQSFAASEAARAQVEKSLAALKSNPADPAANLVAGRYFCLVQGDWAKGLPMLAHGSDALLAALASREVSAAPTIDPIALGDGWWDASAGEKDVEQKQMRSHAASWYRRAESSLGGLQRMKVEKRVAEAAADAPRNAHGDALNRLTRRGKLLLIFVNEERKTAVAACDKYGLPYDLAKSFDGAVEDYSAYRAILCGSNMMDFWDKPENKSPEAFAPLDRFVSTGGHLVIFGSFNARGTAQLKAYGIQTSYYHGDFFAPVPGTTDLLFQGNEDLIPQDRRLHSAGNFKCVVPHTVLLKRAKSATQPEETPLMITEPWKRGRITYNVVEPNWKQPKDGLWLITVTISWISRGSPIPG